MHLRDVITQFKNGHSDEWVADQINTHLPDVERVTRQTVWQWQKKNSADSGVFYALFLHAPLGSEVSQFAYNALIALGRILVEDVSS